MFIEECSQLLKPGYLPLETGYTKLSNGQWLSAAHTRMPNVNGKMLYWWFATYLDSFEKYKAWDQAHLRFEWDDKKKPGQYIGASHICEEISGGLHVKLRIKFEDPAKYFDTSKFAEAGIELAICSTVYVLDSTEIDSRMIHIVRTTEYGVEQRFRCWLYADDEMAAMGVVEHTISEMGRLADFLPGLYARETRK